LSRIWIGFCAREEAGKGFVVRGILKDRWYGISEDVSIIHVVEQMNSS